MDTARITGPRASEVFIETLMSSKVVCVAKTASADELRTLFLAEGISGAPVVDDGGQPVGVVSKTDLVRDPHGTAGNLMTPLVFWLPKTANVAQAAAMMAYEGVHRILVMDEAGLLVGLLSASDILRWLARGDGYVVPEGRSAA